MEQPQPPVAAEQKSAVPPGFRTSEVRAGGETLLVREMNVGQIARAGVLWAPIIERFTRQAEPDVTYYGGHPQLIDIAALAVVGGDAQRLRELSTADWQALLLAVLELNPNLVNLFGFRFQAPVSAATPPAGDLPAHAEPESASVQPPVPDIAEVSHG